MNTDHAIDRETPDRGANTLGAMSKHHVLYLTCVAPTLPSHLFRPLFLLAVHADHSTGRSRPGYRVFEEEWGIPYSSWHRQMQQLAELGLIKQVVKGNKKACKAAEYQLLYAPDLANERPSSYLSAKDPSPDRGGEGTGEKGRGDVPLTDAEHELWDRLSQKVRGGLTEAENQLLTEQSLVFDRMARLKRTALRIAQEYGGEYDVIAALTERRKPGRPAYDGVDLIPAAMWARVRTLADRYGFDMANQSPVVVELELNVPAVDALAVLDEAVPGLARVVAGIGKFNAAER